jgi:putative transposase
MATGLAIVHAMLPKQIWLARHNISTPWPASGHIRMIHLDNAREFHGHMLDRACESYGIEIAWASSPAAVVRRAHRAAAGNVRS